MEMSHVVVPVVEDSQPSAARRTAQRLAGTAGLDEEGRYRAGLVATELATNLVKHTTAGGELLIRAQPAAQAVELIAIDRGPGLANVERAMDDGYSTSGSPGTGLGAIRRLSDEFDIYSTSRPGTVVLARVGRRRRPTASASVLTVGGVSVPVTGETVCGDGWLVLPHPAGPIAAVVDGLGHGPIAAEAAAAAAAALTGAGFSSLPEALSIVHDGLRATRGAALSLLQIDAVAGVARFAGVGNVGGLICQNGTERRAVSLNGTLGHSARTFRDFSYPWLVGSAFVMFTDGLISHWSLTDYPGLLHHDPALAAAVLYRDYSRGRDDVTVVVGRSPL
jgi:anti-sigma regulatory factor (Ser/Thr protein kinase)